MVNRGKREALVLGALSTGAKDATTLASEVIHERATAREILPTLKSMERRGLVTSGRLPGEYGPIGPLLWGRCSEQASVE